MKQLEYLFIQVELCSGDEAQVLLRASPSCAPASSFALWISTWDNVMRTGYLPPPLCDILSVITFRKSCLLQECILTPDSPTTQVIEYCVSTCQTDMSTNWYKGRLWHEWGLVGCSRARGFNCVRYVATKADELQRHNSPPIDSKPVAAAISVPVLNEYECPVIHSLYPIFLFIILSVKTHQFVFCCALRSPLPIITLFHVFVSYVCTHQPFIVFCSTLTLSIMCFWFFVVETILASTIWLVQTAYPKCASDGASSAGFHSFSPYFPLWFALFRLSYYFLVKLY